MSESKVSRAWRLYLLLGVLSASVHFLVPASETRDLVYDVLISIIGVTTIGVVSFSLYIYRPARSLPWYLFIVGLLLLAGGNVFLTVSELLGRELVFPAPSDVANLAFYPFILTGMLMIGNPRLARSGSAGVIDPLIVATGFGVLFWVYFMEPYIVEAYAGHPSITPVSIVMAIAYPLMDLLLIVVGIRTLVVSKSRFVSYYLLGSAFVILLFSDIVWMVAQALRSRPLDNLVDLGFLLFFSLFGAAALHPSMASLFEPVSKVDAKLTRLRLALLAGASLMAPMVIALQAARGERVNVTLFVVCSATLFLLVVARLAGMMKAQERAADREKILRRAGAALAASQTIEDLQRITIQTALELLGRDPVVTISLWVGSGDGMYEIATSGQPMNKHLDMDDMTEEVRKRFLRDRSLRLSSNDFVSREVPCSNSKAQQVFVIPLRMREEPTGAVMVASQIPVSPESQNALEALGAEIALALENLQLLEEVRQTSILKERQRLSHEIHDTLAQGFTSIMMNLSTAQLAHPEVFSDAAPARRHLELAQQIARESLAETRRLVWALRPEALDRHPLPQALQGLTEEWSRKTGIEARFGVAGDSRQLLPEIEVALLRIAQEALANAYKHARADLVVITLSYLEDQVALDVSDDGIGFDQLSPKSNIRPQDSGGFGLVSMRERVEQLDGSLSVESRPGRGTTLTATLPAPLLPQEVDQGTRKRETVEETR